MTKMELMEVIKNGENSGVEFKRDTIENRALAKELVAFANLRGGSLLLGIEDDGSVSGLTRGDPPDPSDPDKPRSYKKLEEWVMTACRDKIRPELVPYFQVLRDVEGGRDVAVVTVDRGWGVHHVWHDNHRTYYIRVGSLSREASWEELERLSQQRGALRLEVRGVPGSSMNDLDFRRLRDYFGRVRGQQVPAEAPDSDSVKRLEQSAKERAKDNGKENRWREIFDLETRDWYEQAKKQWEKLLVNTEILVEQENRQLGTVAGILLFGANPNRFLPQAGIDAVAYPGLEKDYAAKERLTIRGPIVPLYGVGEIIETGLVERTEEFVRRNTGVVAHLEDGVRRVEKSDYPKEAIREAIVNALVHRDYLLSGTDIELSIYEDRLEIISPGRLVNGITPERMRIGCRSARNLLIKDILRDYGYLEHMGMGIPRKIIRAMREHNGTEPDLIEDGERFLLRLWKRKANS